MSELSLESVLFALDVHPSGNQQDPHPTKWWCNCFG